MEIVRAVRERRLLAMLQRRFRLAPGRNGKRPRNDEASQSSHTGAAYILDQRDRRQAANPRPRGGATADGSSSVGAKP